MAKTLENGLSMIETHPLNHNWSHFVILQGLTLHQFQKKLLLSKCLTSLQFAGGKGIRKTFFKCFHSYIWIMEGYVRPCTETRSGNSKTSQNTSGNPFVSLLQFRLSCIALFFSSCVQNQSPKLSCHVSVFCKNLKDYEIFVPFRQSCINRIQHNKIF